MKINDETPSVREFKQMKEALKEALKTVGEGCRGGGSGGTCHDLLLDTTCTELSYTELCSMLYTFIDRIING